MGKKGFLHFLQLGEAEQQLFYADLLKDHHRLHIVLHRSAAHHHPVTKLGMADMVAVT